MHHAQQRLLPTARVRGARQDAATRGQGRVQQRIQWRRMSAVRGEGMSVVVVMSALVSQFLCFRFGDTLTYTCLWQHSMSTYTQPIGPRGT